MNLTMKLRFSRFGFTLIELPCLMLPLTEAYPCCDAPAGACPGAREERGVKTQCIGNQKQLDNANLMYANDNRDLMAFCNWDGV